MKAPRTRGQADQAVRQAETRLYAKSRSGFEPVFSVGNTQPEATIRRLRCGGEPGALPSSGRAHRREVAGVPIGKGFTCFPEAWTAQGIRSDPCHRDLPDRLLERTETVRCRF